MAEQAPTTGGTSRRTALRGAGLAAVTGLGLTGCGSTLAAGMSGNATQRHTLTYWNLLSGGDGDRMVAMERAYQRTHPGVRLEATTLAWGNPYYTKLTLATLGGQPPDVGIAHLTRATVLAQSDLLEPLSHTELAEFGMTADRFNAVAWRTAHTGGELYAIPLDTHPFVLYYNTTVCRKAGLLTADGALRTIDGPDAFRAALAAAKRVTGRYGAVASINGDNATPWRLFATLYYQLGGDVLADNGRRVVLDEAKAERVLSYLAELSRRELMPGSVDYNAATTAFSTNQAGFYLQGDWEVTTFLTARTTFSMTGFPQVFGDSYVAQADSHSFVLPRDPGRDPARRRRALRFVRTLLDHSDTWVRGGHVPAWLPFRDSPAYHRIVPQSRYAGVADHVRYDDPGWYSGSGSDFENIMGSVTGVVLAGRLSPSAGVRQMVRKLRRYAGTPSPV